MGHTAISAHVHYGYFLVLQPSFVFNVNEKDEGKIIFNTIQNYTTEDIITGESNNFMILGFTVAVLTGFFNTLEIFVAKHYKDFFTTEKFI